eukprot:scaffold10938_cov64-Cylindrotheca_fusiformis.AAC.1
MVARIRKPRSSNGRRLFTILVIVTSFAVFIVRVIDGGNNSDAYKVLTAAHQGSIFHQEEGSSDSSSSSITTTISTTPSSSSSSKHSEWKLWSEMSNTEQDVALEKAFARAAPYGKMLGR